MIQFLKNFIKAKYEPLNRIEIFAQNILDNVAYLQSLQPQTEIFPVLKSNAYGHGLKEICKILEKSSVIMLAVDSFPEAQIIYKHSKKKVLILGEMPLEAYKSTQLSRTEFCVYNITTLKHLASLKKNIKIHLFLNTGMNREGIQDLGVFLKKAKKYLKNIEITGLCSHLASGDDSSDLNKKQEEQFFKDLDFLNKNNIFPKWIHLGNSAGTFILKDKRFTAFRPGISTYGYNVFPQKHSHYKRATKLKPALRVLSTITAVQELQKGDIVSYNETFVASKKSYIGTIPFGYYEGLDRRLSNTASMFTLQGKNRLKGNIAGRVCMNLSCINFGTKKVKVGDTIEIISHDKKRLNNVQSIANIEGTIPYEVLVKLQSNIRRVIIW